MATDRQLGLDRVLGRRHAHLLQRGDFGLREGLVAEVGQGGAPPQLERTPQQTGAGGRVPFAAGLGDQISNLALSSSDGPTASR